MWVPCEKSLIWADRLTLPHAHTNAKLSAWFLYFFFVFLLMCVSHVMRRVTYHERAYMQPTTNSKRWYFFVCFLSFFLDGLVVCRQNLNVCSRPKPIARYYILWRQFIRIIAVMRLCFLLDARSIVYIFIATLI